MMSEHEHVWEVVLLGREPVGISCECGLARATEAASRVVQSGGLVHALKIKPTVGQIYDVDQFGTYVLMNYDCVSQLNEPGVFRMEFQQYVPF